MGELDIYHLCNNVMHISVAPKVNKILMGGFQVPYSEKFIKLLIQANYTVVLIEQTSGWFWCITHSKANQSRNIYGI